MIGDDISLNPSGYYWTSNSLNTNEEVAVVSESFHPSIHSYSLPQKLWELSTCICNKSFEQKQFFFFMLY